MCLAHRHRIVICKRTLKRILRRLGLFRRKFQSEILEIAVFLEQQVARSGQLHGYRWMHLKCIQAGYTVSHETVRQLLLLLDPEGVAIRGRRRLRRRRYCTQGPNNVWHIDSYDKLKPYGIAINGCIDGFSRNIIWLEAYSTNNDPKVIASYYITAVKVRKGCPQIMRADRGTENGHVQQMQQFLRRNDQDEYSGEKSFLYGASTANQRIEWWWGILRKENVQYYINLFETIKEHGDFDGGQLDKGLIQFTFMNLIQVSKFRYFTMINLYELPCPCTKHICLGSQY